MICVCLQLAPRTCMTCLLVVPSSRGPALEAQRGGAQPPAGQAAALLPLACARLPPHVNFYLVSKSVLGCGCMGKPLAAPSSELLPHSLAFTKRLPKHFFR